MLSELNCIINFIRNTRTVSGNCKVNLFGTLHLLPRMEIPESAPTRITFKMKSETKGDKKTVNV